MSKAFVGAAEKLLLRGQKTRKVLRNMKKIEIDKKQIGELMELCGNYELLSDMKTAAKIFKDFMIRYSVRESPDFSFESSLGAILRIGFVMGQRTERRRRKQS